MASELSIEFHNRAQIFASTLWNEIQSTYVLENSAYPDHICYRTSSSDNYEKSKNLISTIAILLIESEVNGRNIATYRLNEPIIIDSKNSIWIIEIPAPKKNSHYDEGFEHIEIVTQLNFEDVKLNSGQQASIPRNAKRTTPSILGETRTS